ncbi:MAG: hypothetical protein COB44_08310 [Idiomarina sp.]|nr:MAG: hypothetical protein COB44_08310 [Idiomarina sp.]
MVKDGDVIHFRFNV